VSAGELTPIEAADLTRVLNGYAQALQAVDFEKRLSALAWRLYHGIKKRFRSTSLYYQLVAVGCRLFRSQPIEVTNNHLRIMIPQCCAFTTIPRFFHPV
jgi:hypothetical protein